MKVANYLVQACTSIFSFSQTIPSCMEVSVRNPCMRCSTVLVLALALCQYYVSISISILTDLITSYTQPLRKYNPSRSPVIFSSNLHLDFVRVVRNHLVTGKFSVRNPYLEISHIQHASMKSLSQLWHRNYTTALLYNSSSHTNTF